MDDLNRDMIEGTLDFFILNTISHEPLPGAVIDHRIQQIRRMLELAAERNGKSSPGSSFTAFQRLERAGWVEIEWRQSDSGSEKIYSLTPTGREQLEAERTRQSSTLARFVEDGAWDDSFSKFLSRNM